MKIPRSLNHRGFNIEPAGYFNVLRPAGRFTASQLQRRFPYLVRQSKADAGDTTPLQIGQPVTDHGGLLRWALIVLAAIGLTLGFFEYLRL